MKDRKPVQLTGVRDQVAMESGAEVVVGQSYDAMDPSPGTATEVKLRQLMFNHRERMRQNDGSLRESLLSLGNAILMLAGPEPERDAWPNDVIKREFEASAKLREPFRYGVEFLKDASRELGWSVYRYDGTKEEGRFTVIAQDLTKTDADRLLAGVSLGMKK